MDDTLIESISGKYNPSNVTDWKYVHKFIIFLLYHIFEQSTLKKIFYSFSTFKYHSFLFVFSFLLENVNFKLN